MATYDVVVVGAGHAGVEAAWAAARLGRSVAICTLSDATVAHMPCNPAIGGTAKGHLVREIDALGGLMGVAIDATGIQFKLLNRSRGPAVWSPRAQADKRLYSRWVRERLASVPEHRLDFCTGPFRSRRSWPRRGAAPGRRPGCALPGAGDHHGNVPERTDSRGPRTAPGWPSRRTAVHGSRTVAQELWVQVGTAENRDAPAAGSQIHRLFTVPAGIRRQSSASLLIHLGSHRPTADRMSSASYE